RAQLGRGWTVSSPAPHAVPPIACARVHTGHTGAARPLVAASPVFAAGSSGPFLSQTGYVYPTPTQAAAVWRAVAGRPLLACLARSFARGGRHGVTFRVTARRLARAPRVGAAAVLLSLQATASGAGQSDQAFLDVLLVHSGPAIDELSFTSLLVGPPRSLESRIGRVAARRLKDTPGRSPAPERATSSG
ncbi:MAG: hypothetical protein ACRDMJ_19225, partial [Solirubrobacteraceae bacterium]